MERLQIFRNKKFLHKKTYKEEKALPMPSETTYATTLENRRQHLNENFQCLQFGFPV